jgi:hypothetical protein
MELAPVVPLAQTVLWIALIVGIAVFLRKEISDLRRILIDRLRDGGKLVIGPVEFGELRQKVNDVATVQQRQGRELDTLRFLISNLLPKYEFDHLVNLNADKPFPFGRNPNFDNELRHLRNLGFIEHCHHTPFGIRALPNNGEDLRTFLRVTDRGKEYLKLRREAQDWSAPDAD